jgi:chloride channel 3/4/5
VTLFIGIASGILAAFIGIAAEWLTDLKQGYCEDAWYLNQKFCCWQESGIS